MKEKRRKKRSLAWLLYAWLAIFIAAYALSQNALVGAFSLLLIVVILVIEVKESVSTEGVGRSVVDIATAIGAAVLVWLLLVFVLHTTAPVDAVSSCSMLPSLHRGDMVVLMGISNFSKFVAARAIPVVNVPTVAFQSMQGNISSEFLAFYAYSPENRSEISAITSSSSPEVGLYNTRCLSTYSYSGSIASYSKCAVDSQAGNLIGYSYSLGRVVLGNRTYNIVFTSKLRIGNVSVVENYSNPVIVYATTPKDVFSGSIIHRVFAILNVSGSYYFLTKGDNNQALDVEFGNYPVSEKDALGYVIAVVPFVGYVKLLLSGELAVPQGCNQTILR